MSKSYREVVDRAELQRISLSSSSFKVRGQFGAEIDRAKRFHHTTTSAPHIDDQSNLIAGMVNCRVWMCKSAEPNDTSDSTSESSDEEILSIEAKYMVVFSVPGSHNKTTIEAFFKRMAPFSVWPYFRSHVARMGSEATINIPILPIKKLFAPVETSYVDPTDESEGSN